MSDRQLLELAAKAAGITDGVYCELVGGDPALYSKHANLGIWAPLTDDGDRYRLARALGISIDFSDCCAWKRFADGRLIQEFWGGDCGDEAHAVLRVAVEIGRSMNRSE